MRFQRTKHPQPVPKYIIYSPTSLTNAYLRVKEEGYSVRRASKQYNVPITTLRDRVLGKIDPECVTTGRPPVFSLEEEVKIVDFLKLVANYGYGYTRSEVSQIAFDYAVQIGKRRSVDSAFTRGWLDGFFERWPAIKVLRPRSLELARAKSASSERIDDYFKNLEAIIQKYNLSDKPRLIFNVDEKGVSPNNTPPFVVAPAGSQVQAVTTGKSPTTTVLGCGNALGTCIPPYFVFQGIRWRDELLAGATPGVTGTVSETGWSNASIFRDYLQHHFIKYAPPHDDFPILLFMDGHSTHVSVGLLEWAKSMNIVIFILPEHTSHILQPLDVSCYGPFQRMFNTLCHRTRRGSSCDITRYNVCELGCKVYYKALSAENLMSGFRATGIFPFDRSVISPEATKPAEVFHSTDSAPVETQTESKVDIDENVGQESSNINLNLTEGDMDTVSEEQTKVAQTADNFFDNKILKLKEVKSNKSKKTRKSLSKFTSGKPVTEDETLSLIKQYEQNKSCKSSMKPVNSKKTKGSNKKVVNSKQNKSMTSEITSSKATVRAATCNSSPKPGPSCVYLDSTESDSEHDSEIQDDDKCCVCRKFTPDAVRNSVALIFTKWVQCSNDGCNHWAHLGLCTKERVIRRGDIFYCTHCKEE